MGGRGERPGAGVHAPTATASGATGVWTSTPINGVRHRSGRIAIRPATGRRLASRARHRCRSEGTPTACPYGRTAGRCAGASRRQSGARDVCVVQLPRLFRRPARRRSYLPRPPGPLARAPAPVCPLAVRAQGRAGRRRRRGRWCAWPTRPSWRSPPPTPSRPVGARGAGPRAGQRRAGDVPVVAAGAAPWRRTVRYRDALRAVVGSYPLGLLTPGRVGDYVGRAVYLRELPAGASAALTFGERMATLAACLAGGLVALGPYLTVPGRRLGAVAGGDGRGRAGDRGAGGASSRSRRWPRPPC